MKNKLNIGDRVELKRSALKVLLDDFTENYMVPGETELEWEDKVTLSKYMQDYLSANMPRGRVAVYGSLDEGDKLCVYVDFGKKDHYSHFYSESDLKKVSK